MIDRVDVFSNALFHVQHFLDSHTGLSAFDSVLSLQLELSMLIELLAVVKRQSTLELHSNTTPQQLMVGKHQEFHPRDQHTRSLSSSGR